MPRVIRTGAQGVEKGRHPVAPSSSLTFIPSGCQLLNLVLTGGGTGAWPLGRISNIVGDKSVGKTLLAIEATAEFNRVFPKGLIFYRESEYAFDEEYARALGMPVDRVNFWDHEKEPFDTVEQFFRDLKEQAEKCIAKKVPGFYVLDSLDALSDTAEMEREIDTNTYGQDKAKKMSELFRKLVRLVGNARMHLMIISQVRDNIGVSWGRKTTRAGGRALNFYASQIVYLTHLGQVDKTRNKQKRVVGVKIKAQCDKNKVGPSFRDCEFEIRFNYGIADFRASVTWLKTSGNLKALGVTEKQASDLIDDSDQMSADEYLTWERRVNQVTAEVWAEIENDFLPKRRKRELVDA